MSTFAAPSPAMTRLFEQIDSAEPEHPRLRAAFRYWQAKRGARLLPGERALDDLPAELEADAFMFERARTTGEWTLHRVGEAARELMRPSKEDWRLAGLGTRRLAVRLRRLFDMVAESAEPVAASFELDGADRRMVDVLAAPLETDDSVAGAVFGVVVARSETVAGRSAGAKSVTH